MEKNSNPQDWPQYNVNTLKYVQSHLTIPMSLGSQRALTCLRSRPNKSCVLAHGNDIATNNMTPKESLFCTQLSLICLQCMNLFSIFWDI